MLIKYKFSGNMNYPKFIGKTTISATSFDANQNLALWRTSKFPAQKFEEFNNSVRDSVSHSKLATFFASVQIATVSPKNAWKFFVLQQF